MIENTLVAYILGAFLGGATVFALLYSVILNQKQEISFLTTVNEAWREKVKSFTEDVKEDGAVTEEAGPDFIPTVEISESGMHSLMGVVEEENPRAVAYGLYTQDYREAIKQVVTAIEEENRQSRIEELNTLLIAARRDIMSWVRFGLSRGGASEGGIAISQQMIKNIANALECRKT